LPGGSFEINLEFSANPEQPNGYIIESPPRMIFDFQNTRTGLPKKTYGLSFDLAKSAVVVSTEDRTRLIVNMNQSAGYDLRTEGNKVAIVIGDQQGSGHVQDRFVSRPGTSSAPGAGLALTGVDFQRGRSEERRVGKKCTSRGGW